MKRSAAITLLAGLAATLPAGLRADEARLLRFPATNGSEIAFSYAGDLYTVPAGGGEAKRLTSHVGYEMFPRFSPDGKKIAFTGQYDGNTEVYLIPAGGGEPQRLTYSPTLSRDDLGDRMGPNNIVMTWKPDGSAVVYRNRTGSSFQGQLLTVSPEGGMPTQIPLPEGGFCSWSPDGKKLAYNRVMREFRTWKYYKGGMADDVWIYDPQAKTVVNITDNPAQDIFPMWIGDEIYFASDRDKTMNLFAYDTKTKQTRKVTDFKDYDVKFPSSDGHTIVFENGGYIYRYDPAQGKAQKVNISVGGENPQARKELKPVGDRITAASLSPDGANVALTARGEVFNVPAKKGLTRYLTRTPGANERNAAWSPDGKHIAYISDRTGETEVWMQDPEGGEPVQLTKNNDTYIRSILWTPDSRHILYTDRKNRLVEVDPAAKSKRTLMENPESEFRGVAVSPDSKWLAYTKPASNDMGVVYVYNRATGKEYPVTEKWYSSSSPVFSTDGKYLLFSSDRDFNPTYGQLEWNHVFNNLGGLYLAMLSADTPSPLLPAADKAPAKEEAAEAVVVKIDPQGISERIVKLPLGAGRYYGFASDGKKVYYNEGGSARVLDLASQENKPLAEGAMMTSLTADAKKALFSKGGKMYVADLAAPALDKPIDTANVVAIVDYSEEWPQIFDEVWRAYRDGFYLENMHGVDWNAIKAKYAALVPYAKTRLDLNYIIGEMISELGCGHAYVNPGEKPEAPRVGMGLLGAELSRDKSGHYRIDRILPGAPYRKELRSPLTEPGLDVKAGDYIVAIDGVDTKTTDNIYTLLAGKSGVLTELTLSSSASGANPHKIVIEPIDDESELRHHEWVEGNLRKVEEATGGRVGYVYIPDMNVEGLREFARYFYPQLDKEALIVDDRANGGGNISPMIIERLLREPYRMTMSRGSSKTHTVPDATVAGPKVLLINKYSASDGDLFPWSWKANDIGPVIGTRTWGGIVGISGSLPYMDGTDVRVPFFTNYDAKTGQWIVENHGVDPDILIDNDPIREQAGEDQQLDRAIEEIMKLLKTRKPLPGVPRPRTFKDLGIE